MPEPLSRLQLARDEINKTFGPDFAEQHPELVIAVMNAASSDWAACANTVGPGCECRSMLARTGYRDCVHRLLQDR
jgi:hypothetical protein